METDGVSGDEAEVRAIIEREIKPYVDEVKIDKMGNLIARKKGKRPRIMLAAHMDELGLMIRRIDEQGKIYVSDIGFTDPMLFVGQKVNIKTKKGKISGIITTETISSGHEIKKLPDIKDLIIDTGYNGKELEEIGVEIGTYLSLDQENGFLGNKEYIFGKAVDDRTGCFALLEIAKRLKEAKSEIYFVFTVQEEIGMYGAKTSAYTVEPDWAMAIDTTNANDFEEHCTKILGKGPSITAKDTDTVVNQGIIRNIRETAKKNNIPVQMEVSHYGTTDAMNISITKGGIPCGVITIPQRNIHTTVGIVNAKDIENLVKLVVALLKKPPIEGRV